jgi:Phage capsid family
MAPALSSAAAAISKYDRIKSADRFVERIAAMVIGSIRNLDAAHVLKLSGRTVTKENNSPLTQTGQSALRQDALAFADVYQADSAVAKLLAAGAIAADVGDRVVSSTHDPVAAWVGEFENYPAGGFDFTAPQLTSAKLGAIEVITNELARLVGPRGLGILRAIIARVDSKSVENKLFGDDAAVELESPAGLLNGLSSVGAGSPDDLDEVSLALFDAVRESDAWRFVISPRLGAYLATLRDEDGDARFPTVGPLGGTLLGVPVIVSAGARQNLILLDARSIAIADDGLEVALSRVSAIQMTNTPTNSASNVVSLWQTNSTALKFTHYITWAKIDSDGVAFAELPIAASPA